MRSGPVRCPRASRPGQAVATTAGLLPARWVIHTVGPVWSSSEDRSHLLSSCYRECLRVADELGAESVAFPAVSAGVYRWPLEDAASIALSTVENTPTAVREVRFVLFTPAAHEVFAEALARRPRPESATGPLAYADRASPRVLNERFGNARSA